MRIVISCGGRSFCGVAAINKPAQKSWGKELEIRNSEELQLKKKGRVMNLFHVECADDGPAQRPCFVNGNEADSFRTFGDVSVIKGAEIVA